MKQMMHRKAGIVKAIALILVISFVADGLVLLDILEIFDYVRHSSELEQGARILARSQGSDESRHHSDLDDTCVLCPCCAADIEYLPSTNTLSIELARVSVLILTGSREESRFKHQIFRPPRFSA